MVLKKMSGKKEKVSEAVVLLIDVNNGVKEEDSDGQTFLFKSKECASRVIQRKIFSDSTDQFGIVVMGSERTDNALEYPNISILNSFLTSANWGLLRDIGGLSPTDVDSGCWLDGLIVAINILKDESECKKFERLKILMFSNLATKIRSSDQVDDVIETLRDMKISLVVIGPEIEEDSENCSEDTVKSKTQQKGEVLISRIIEEVEGVICNFEEAMTQLDHFQKRTGKPQAWNCDLTIGGDIYIPITGYKKFASKNILKWSKRRLGKAPIVQETVFFRGDTQLEKTDVISSYLLGQSIVPTTDEDRASWKLATEKCLKVIGFTKKNNVPRHIFGGDSVYYITPRKDMQSAEDAVTALVKAMLELEMVAVVRKVYCKNASPQLGALIPTCENDCYFFYYAQLPFADDVQRTVFPSLKHVQLTQEQQAAIDQLVDVMDLSQFEEDEDPYMKLVNPGREHEYNTIIFRALHPDSVLPAEPSKSVKSLIQPKPEIIKNALSCLENIKRLFPLKEVEEKSIRRGAAEVFKRKSNDLMEVEDKKPKVLIESMVSFVQSKVTEIGTVDPEGNFLKLMELGESFDKLCEQMQTAITKLFITSNSTEGMQKPLSALSLLRKHCVEKPLLYNQFITSLKEDFVERDRHEVWDKITQDKLGLITQAETDKSNVSIQEAEKFYEIVKCESQNEQNEMEAEDMLDMI